MCNDILLALDSRQEVVLVLLDLPSTFDTIDHDVLLDRLRSRYGIQGTALNWFRSYLTNRTQSVRIGDSSSSNRTLKYGVPQGSVLGPLLFSLFFEPIEEMILDHGLRCMVYADDTQLYLTVKARCDLPVMLFRLQLCIIDIFTWCTNNGLACRLDKAEVAHLRSCHAKNFDPIQEIVIDDVVIVPKPVVRDLGLLIDSHLLLKNQVNQVCKCAWSAIRKIGRIRSHLTQDVSERLVHAFITSKLDSYNSVLYGLPSCELDQLQRVQNVAARLVTMASKSDHITPILFKLHWLPVKERITFKLLLITFKAPA